ncbi:MAG: IS3 family transposase, partial [Christensenellaceae bacterium]
MNHEAMEPFFGGPKAEIFYGASFDSVEALTDKLHSYVDYSNNERISIQLKRNEPGSIPSS